MSAFPSRPPSVRPVPYKDGELDAERGPGLGCFRFQLVLLLILVVLTPITVVQDWPVEVSAFLLFLTIALLLVSGQTIIFLLRLVAADRAAGRRRPLASGTRTVGEIEDAEVGGTAQAGETGADESARDHDSARDHESALPDQTAQAGDLPWSSAPQKERPDVRQ